MLQCMDVNTELVCTWNTCSQLKLLAVVGVSSCRLADTPARGDGPRFSGVLRLPVL